MTQEKAYTLVQGAIEEQMYIKPDEYNLDSKLTGPQIGADSLDIVEMSMIIEEKIKQEINIKDLYSIQTVRDVVKLIEGYECQT